MHMNSPFLPDRWCKKPYNKRPPLVQLVAKDPIRRMFTRIIPLNGNDTGTQLLKSDGKVNDFNFKRMT